MTSHPVGALSDADDAAIVAAPRVGRRRFELRIFVDIEPIELAGWGDRVEVTTSVGVAPSVAHRIDRFVWKVAPGQRPADEQAAHRLGNLLSFLRGHYEGA